MTYQFSLKELRSVVSVRDSPRGKIMWDKLNKKYGDDIKLKAGRGNETLILFTDTEY